MKDCWLFAGCISDTGYGRLGNEYVHRIVYEQTHNVKLAREQHIDHLCRVRACMNPEHLEPVTCKENILRGEGMGARNAKKTHCISGHEFTPDNLYHDKRGWRVCATCNLANTRRRQSLP